MSFRPIHSFEAIDEAQLTKVHLTFDLLAEHLLPEERDAAGPSYRLDWYGRMQARECSREDIAHFRRFVEEMCERASQRASRTEALFPASRTNQANDKGGGLDVLRARRLCESFCASLDDDLKSRSGSGGFACSGPSAR